MATIRNSLTDNSAKDTTGDAINGSEVDLNPQTIADILDGTTATDLGQVGTVDVRNLVGKVVDNAAASVKTALVVEWDPADDLNMTDNSSGIGIDFKLPDDADTQTVFASLDVMCRDDAAASEDGEFSFRVMVAATDTEVATLNSGLTTTGTVLTLMTGETTVVDGDILGKIEFQAPSEASGTDAILVGAAIWAEADDTFAADNNDTDLVFAIAESEAAAERMRLSYDGTSTGLSFTTATAIDTGGNNALTLNPGTAALTVTAGDLTLYDDNNNADTSLSIGTSATERLKIEVLNGAANKSAESVNITSVTAAAGANAGQITIGIDEATILTIDDSGINAVLGATTAAAASATTITGSGVLSIDDTTDTTSATTGSIHTDGGLGVAKALWVGTTSRLVGAVTCDAVISVDDTTDSTSTTTGSIHTDGGLGVAKDIYAGDDIFLVADGVLNWGAGDVTVTGGTNTLTVAGGTFATAALTATTLGTNGLTSLAGGDVTLADGYGMVLGGVSQHTVIGLVSEMQVTGTGGDDSAIMLGRWSASSGGPYLLFAKSRGATIGALGAAADNDALGTIIFGVDDGVDLASHAAYIAAEIDGATVGENDTPGALVFATTADGTASATERMRITSAGNLFLNETANTFMTQGLTINQGQNDDEILALKSAGDVVHPMTGSSGSEADTYGTFSKLDATAGGLYIRGFRSSAGTAGGALHLGGFLGEAADATKSTAALGVVMLKALITDGGTGLAAVGTDGNLVTMGNGDTVRFIFDAEGSGHADVEWALYDDFDDIAVMDQLQALAAEKSPRLTPARYGDNSLEYGKEWFEENGIVGKGSWHRENGKLRSMVNFTKLHMLHHGAILQLAERGVGMEGRMARLEQENKELKALVAARGQM